MKKNPFLLSCPPHVTHMLILALWLPSALFAANTDTWVGGSGNNFSTTANWTFSPGSGPVASGDSLVFSTVGSITPNNDGTGFIYPSITYNASALAFTLGGNSFTLGTGTAATALTINNTANSQIINNNITLGNAAQTFILTNGNLTLSGIVGGAGSSSAIQLSATNATLMLTGNNTFQSGVTVTAQSGSGIGLIIGHNNAVGTGTLAFNGGNPTLNCSSAGPFIIPNALTTSRDLAFTGTKDLTVNGLISHSGNKQFIVNGGILTLAGGMTLASGDYFLKSGAGTLVLNGATTGGGSSQTINTVAYSVTARLANNNGVGTLVLGNKSALGAGTFWLEQTGVIQANTDLSGANTVANQTVLANNETIGGANNLTFSGNWINSGNRTLTVTNNAATVFSGNIYLSDLNTTAGTLTLNVSNSAGPTTISGVIANYNGSGLAGALTKTGTGVLTLTATNTFAGGTTISGGTLVVGNTNVFSSGGVTNSTGTLDINGWAITNTINFTGTGGTLTNSSGSAAAITTDANVTGGTSFTIGTAGDITVARLISTVSRTMTKTGTGTLIFNGSGHNNLIAVLMNGGTLVCSNAGGYSADRGFTNSAGTVRLANYGAGAVSTVNANLFNDVQPFAVNGGTFDLNGWNETVAVVAGAGGVIFNNASGKTSTLTIGADNGTANYSGSLQNGSGVLAITKTGTGVQTLLGTNTYTGTTLVNSGILALSGSGSISNTALISVANGAIFDVSGLASTFALGSSQTLSNSASSTGTINGNAGTGPGTVSLTYASGTPSLLVTNGTLTFSSGTVFKINNTGAVLASGSYKIISKATGGNVGAVGGTVPAVTISGAGASASVRLQIIGGELYLVVNHPPAAATLTVFRTAGLSLKVAWSDLTNNWSDADADTVVLNGINLVTTNSINLATNGTFILYPSSLNVNDQFSYTVNDGQGGVASGLVNIVVNSSVTGTNSIVGIVTGGTNVVTAYGIPGYSYILERATNLAPAVWLSVSTNTAATNGLVNATDSFSDLGGTPPGAAYYRLKWQP